MTMKLEISEKKVDAVVHCVLSKLKQKIRMVLSQKKKKDEEDFIVSYISRRRSQVMPYTSEKIAENISRCNKKTLIKKCRKQSNKFWKKKNFDYRNW